MEIQKFNYESNEVRTISIDGEPWWIAKDVCSILDLNNVSMALDGLEDDEKGISKVDTLGGKQNMAIINESGLYSLILRSNKPEAKKFKKWVTSEVLPSIRKTGKYEIESDPAKLISLALVAANKILTEQKPLVEFAEAVRESKDGKLIREFAKSLNPATGEKRLFAWLREQGILLQDSTEPNQRYVDMGIFETRPSTWKDKSGNEHVNYTTLITGKGQLYIEKKWREFNLKRSA